MAADMTGVAVEISNVHKSYGAIKVLDAKPVALAPYGEAKITFDAAHASPLTSDCKWRSTRN